MKKSLLFAFAMCGAVALNAMEPLTPEQLAELSVKIDTNEDGTFCQSVNSVLTYAEGSNTIIKLPNFNNGENEDVQTIYVDWDKGTVWIIANYFGYAHYDDNYQPYYLFAVNKDAANLSSPMDPSFTSSRINGTITEDGITLEPWSIVKVSNNFQTLTKVSTQPVTTKIVKPNATMSVKRLEWDEDWENLIPYSQVDVEGKEYPDKRVYTEVNGTQLSVYHWDDNPSCAVFDQKCENGNYTYSIPTDRNIFVVKGKKPLYICALPGYTWDAVNDSYKAEDAKPLVSEIITNPKELSFGAWLVVHFSDYNDQRTFASSCKLTLDTPLQLGTSGVEEAVAGSEPVKVSYFNLNGVETAAPAGGIFVKVSTYADGSVKAVKVAK